MPKTKVVTSRLSVRLPSDAKDEIDRLAEIYGVKRGAFYAMAISLGAKTLKVQMEPEKLLSKDILVALAKSMEG